MQELCEPIAALGGSPAPIAAGACREMTDVLTTWVLVLLGLAGVLALAFRFVRATGRALLSAAEVAAASGIADVSARRGDLTRMREGREVERRARAVRRRSALTAGVWLLWLGLPLALGAFPLAYAVAAPLWLVPVSPLRGRKAGDEARR